jgi:hypothetical protein
MMVSEARTAPRRRATEALESVAHQYDLRADMAALERAGDDWWDEAIAQLAEGLAALLLDVPSRPGSVERKRHH